MPATPDLLIVSATLLLAGLVKGVIGMGLPTVTLSLLAISFDLTFAMALLLAPSLVTNLWQAIAGGNTRALITRLWPLLVGAMAATWIGALLLTRVDLRLLTALLGSLLAAYAIFSLGGIRFSIRRDQETRLAPLIGVINGVLTGMTGSFVFPGVMYLQALDLNRDDFIRAMGMLFSASTIALGFALWQHQLLLPQVGLLSIYCVLPALLGMSLGQRLRSRLSDQLFRTTFFMAILAIAAYILFNAFRTV